MNLKKLLFTLCMVLPYVLISQVTFNNANSRVDNTMLNSGCAIGVADMNGDGLDDLVRLRNARYLEVEYQSTTPGGDFTRLNYGSITGSGSEWGMVIADVNEDGYNDIIVGGSYNYLKLLTAKNNGTDYDETILSSPQIFLQNANFADIDNNGTIDFFGCNDVGVSSAYSNNGSGSFTYNNSGLINATSTIPSDNSGNYGSIWVDYDNDGDQDLYISKCRLGVYNQYDGRRVNQLFQNDGNGNFTDVGVAAGLVPYAQSWSANFEDIDNDGDLDCVLINHDVSSIIYENNGNGTFTDITASSGIATQLSNLGAGGIQVIMEDFDNDTFVDLFITSRYTSNKHVLFKNNGNKTFSVMPTPFPAGSLSIQSAAVGDLNNDGFIDVIAGFGTGYNSPSNNPDILYLNNGNSNNWSEITLQGVASNRNGIGARIELHGVWGKQIREVRSGESYGTMNSLMSHFGLGTATSITKIVVIWPSGAVDEIYNPNINESFVIVEGSQPLNTESFSAENFSIYPNPTSNYITVNTKNIEDVSYKLYDITGKLVKQQSVLSNSKNQIDLSHFSNGLYFIHLTSNKESYVHKIIKK
ncbi:FG-GAP-like repeat-containing protein [Xanthomarina sp. GH4-25]|uniref:FG-GAP-like repeat-containing protein n=1 Tax=Xanthomarina sp. GH4-25 TaxID=3349335 RepID=UPI000D672B22|nr:CRTAC1 family protein [Flavobacteriaceae bacterium LYZ1037]